MSKRKKPEKSFSMWETYNVETGEYRSGSSGGGGCLLMLLTFGLYALVRADSCSP